MRLYQKREDTDISSEKEEHWHFTKNRQSLSGGQTTTEMTHRVSTLMKCGFPQLLCHQRCAQVRRHFPPHTAETGAACFWTQDTQGMGGGWSGGSLNAQGLLNCSWVSQLLGIWKRIQSKSSPFSFSCQSNYIVWPYWALMPKWTCTRPQNSKFCMKLMGQVETYREVKDNRLEDHAISFSAEAGAHLDSTGRQKSADHTLEHSKGQSLKPGGELGVWDQQCLLWWRRKKKTWKPEEREAKIKELTDLTLNILDRIKCWFPVTFILKAGASTVRWIAAVQWPSAVHKSSIQRDCKLPCCHDKDTVINGSVMD